MTPDSVYIGSAATTPVSQPFNNYMVPQMPEAEKPSWVMGNLEAGIDETQALLWAGAGLTADLFGAQDWAQSAYGKYQENMDEAAKTPREVESLFDINSPGSALTWAGETALRTAPTMVASMLGAGAGAVGARVLGGNLLKSSVAKAIETEAASLTASGLAADAAMATATKSVLGRTAALNKVGSLAGLIGSTTAMEGGGNWAQDVQDQGFGNTSPGQDLLFGLASGISESILGAEAGILSKFLKAPVAPAVERSFLKALGRELPKAMLAEGTQEGFQQLLSNVNTAVNKEGFESVNLDSLNFKELVESFAAGALMGGGASLITTRGTRAPAANTDQASNIDSPVNAAEEIKSVTQTKDPFNTVTTAEASYLAEREKVFSSASEVIEDSYKKESKKSATELSKLEAALKELEHPITEVGIDLSPEDREASRVDLLGKQAAALARVAKLQETKKIAEANLKKRWEADQLRSGKVVVSAQRESIINQDKARRAQFETSPFVFSQLSQVAKDTEHFANSQVKILGNRVNAILRALGKYNTMLEDPSIRRFENTEVYTKFMKSADELHNKLRITNEQIAAIQKKAKGIIRKTADVSTADLGTLNTEMNALYSMRDLKAEGGHNKDVISVFTKNIDTAVDQTIKEQIDAARALGYDADTANVENDPRVLERKDLLKDFYSKKLRGELQTDNDFAEQDRINNEIIRKGFNAVAAQNAKDERKVPKRRATGIRARQDIRELQQLDANLARKEDQRNKDAAWAAEVQNAETNTINRNMTSMFREWNDQALANQMAGAEGIQPIYSQQAGAPTPRATEATPQPSPMAENVEQQTKILDNHIIAHERAMESVEDLAEVAEFNKLKEQSFGKVDVYKSINNFLTKFPALRDVTTVCSTHTDTRVPVDLHAAIVTQIQNGMTPPRGAYFKGQVYIFVSAIQNPAQAAKTMLHEGIAHYGLRAMFNDTDLGNFLRFTRESFMGTPEWAKFLKIRYQYKNSPVIIQAEEFIAWIVEQKRAGTLLERGKFKALWDKFVAFFKGLLIKLDRDSKTNKMSMRDLSEMIDSAVSILSGTSSRVDINRDATIYRSDGKTGIIKLAQSKDMPFGWGFVFSNPKLVQNWFHYYNQTVSGVPGTTNVNATPRVENLANWDAPFENQPKLVQDAIKKLPTRFLLETIPNKYGGMNAYFVGKSLGNFQGPNFLAKVLEDDKIYQGITYADIYNTLVKKTGDKKAASGFMYKAGIAGVRAPYEGKTAYLIYNGDDLLLQTPRYLSDNSDLPPVSYVKEQVEDIDKYNWQWQNLQRRLAEREKWVDKTHKAQQTGKSIADDNTVVEHSWFDRMVEGLHDPYRRLQIIQRQIKQLYSKVGKYPITPITNLYKQLSGLSNIIHNKQIDFANQYVEPMVKALADIKLPATLMNELNKITLPNIRTDKIIEMKMAALGDYTRALHAVERNEEIRSRIKMGPKQKTTEDYRGGPSGMSTSDAQNTIARLESIPGIKDAANAVIALNKAQLQLIEDYRLVPQAMVDKLRETYKNYVPLKGWSEYTDVFLPTNQYRTSSGISTGGKKIVKEAKGRDQELPENPIIASITQAMETIAVGEKNAKSRNLLKLVEATPEMDIWEIGDKDNAYYRLQSNGKGELAFRRKKDQFEGKGVSLVNVIDESGKVVRVAIKDQPLAAALRNENMMKVHPIIDTIRGMTRTLSMLYTNYNPAFFIPNSIRDWESALLNLGGVIDDNKKKELIVEGSTIRKNITKDMMTLRVPRVLWKIINGKPMDTEDESTMQEHYNDFRRLGGHTRMFSARDFKSAYAYLRSEVRKSEGGFLSKGTAVLEYLDKLSDVSENSTRFSVYMRTLEAFDKNTRVQAKAQEWDKAKLFQELEFNKERSANIALDITVNFTRKGTWAPLTNALYAFSSASIGGNARILKNIFRKDASPRERALLFTKFFGSGVLSAMALSAMNRMLMGDDDDGINKYDKIPDYVKERNIVIAAPWGDGYIKIPIAYGYNVFWIIGNEADKMFRGKASSVRSAVTIATSVFDNFSPIGGGEGGFPTVVPTLARPIAEVAVNTNFAGTPIYPKTLGYKGEGPDAYKYFASNPVIYQQIAQAMNAVTGGSKTRSGLIDVSPESIQHIVQSYLGGIGKFVVDTFNLPIEMYQSGGALEIKKVPIINRFAGEIGYQDTSSIFARAANEVYIQNNSVNLAKKDPTVSSKERMKIVQESRTGMALKSSLDGANQKLQDIKDREATLLKRYPSKGSAYTQQMKLLEQQKERVMKSFIKAAGNKGLDYD